MESIPESASWPTIQGIEPDIAARNFDSDVDLFEEILRFFFNENQGFTQSMRALLAAGERDDAAMLAHRLRGQSANLGAVDLRAAAGALEEALRGGREDVGALLETVERDHRILMDSARNWLASRTERRQTGPADSH